MELLDTITQARYCDPDPRILNKLCELGIEVILNYNKTDDLHEKILNWDENGCIL